MLCTLKKILLAHENSLLISVKFKTSKAFVGKFNPMNVLHEEILPEYVYAGENIKAHTRVYAMGIATHGGLGVETFLRPEKKSKGLKVYQYMQRPYRIKFAEINKVKDFSCGYGFTVFTIQAPKGKPSCYGNGITTSGQIGVHVPRIGFPLEIVLSPAPIGIPLYQESFITKVSCGRAHTLAVANDNVIWTFGCNTYGQCGRPTIENEDYSRTHYHSHAIFKDEGVEQVECGQDTSFVLSNGKVYSCGLSADGQTGQNTFENVNMFRPVEGDLKGEKIIKISSGADCILALNDKGEVFGWGNSEYNQLGLIADKEQLATPKLMPLKLPKIVDVGSSGTSCYVVTDEGDVYSWGYGALGRGPNETHCTVPKVIPHTLLGRNILNKESRVIKIYTGITMAAAVTNDGGLYTWGRNVGGCLGLGDIKPKYFPLRVCVAGFVKKVSCGVDHMMVMVRSII